MNEYVEGGDMQCPRCHGSLSDEPTAMGDGENGCQHCGWDLSREWSEAAEEYEMWVDSGAPNRPLRHAPGKEESGEQG